MRQNNYCVLVLSSNPKNLDRLLSSLSAAQSDLKLQDVYVIGEAPEDSLRGKWNVNFINSKKKQTFAYYFNTGVKALPNSLDVFLVNDQGILLTKNGINGLKEIAYSSPSIGLSGPAIAGKTSDSYYNYQSVGELYKPTRRGELEHREGYKSTLNFLAVYIKREILNKIPSIPENIITHGYEDNYFCNRMSEAGYEWIIDPDIIAAFPEWIGFNGPTTYFHNNQTIDLPTDSNRISSCVSYCSENENARLTSTQKSLLEHVKKSILNAQNGVSKLTQEVYEIEGMSSPKGRRLLNNLCAWPNTNYLEIGTWKGSTLISALFGNKKNLSSVTAIDNWSRCGGPEAEFHKNCANFLTDYNYRFHCEDSFQIDLKATFDHPINIYFYDGNHRTIAHEMAFTYYNSVLDDTFITVIDDWNWEEVRQGTLDAFNKLHYDIIFEAVLPARWNKDIEYWWDGLYIALIKKPLKTK